MEEEVLTEKKMTEVAFEHHTCSWSVLPYIPSTGDLHAYDSSEPPTARLITIAIWQFNSRMSGKSKLSIVSNPVIDTA